MERTGKLVIAEALYFDMEDLKQRECVKIIFKNKDRERDRERIIYSFCFVCYYFMCFLCAS